jgi:integrase
MSEAAPRPPRRRLATVAEVCKEYLNRAVGAKTGGGWKSVRAEIGKFVAAKGDIAIEDLLTDDLEQFIEDRPLLKSGWTKKRVAQIIKRAFSFCQKKGLIDRHPFASVSYQIGGRREAMTEDQFRMILRSVSVEYRRVLLFLWWTGARPKELTDLQWKMIDADKSIAVLPEHKTAHSRKDREPRILYLPEKALRMLTWMLDDQRADQEYVFLNRKGGRWDRYRLTERFFRVRAKLGIPTNCKLYGARHSFGTRMALAGVELKTLSVLMGHTNTLQSEHYIHMAGQTKHLHDALEKGLGKKGTSGPP